MPPIPRSYPLPVHRVLALVTSPVANKCASTSAPSPLTNGLASSASVPRIDLESNPASSSNHSIFNDSILVTASCCAVSSETNEHLEDHLIVPPTGWNAPRQLTGTEAKEGRADQDPFAQPVRSIQTKKVLSMLTKLTYAARRRPSEALVPVLDRKQVHEANALSHSSP